MRGARQWALWISRARAWLVMWWVRKHKKFKVLYMCAGEGEIIWCPRYVMVFFLLFSLAFFQRLLPRIRAIWSDLRHQQDNLKCSPEKSHLAQVPQLGSGRAFLSALFVVHFHPCICLPGQRVLGDSLRTHDWVKPSPGCDLETNFSKPFFQMPNTFLADLLFLFSSGF